MLVFGAVPKSTRKTALLDRDILEFVSSSNGPAYLDASEYPYYNTFSALYSAAARRINALGLQGKVERKKRYNTVSDQDLVCLFHL